MLFSVHLHNKLIRMTISKILELSAYKQLFLWAPDILQLESLTVDQNYQPKPRNSPYQIVIRSKVKKLFFNIIQQKYIHFETAKFFNKALEVLIQALNSFEIHQMKWLKYYCKMNFNDYDQQESCDQQIQQFFQEFQSTFDNKDDFSQFKMWEYSKGIQLPETCCLNCLDELVPQYNLNEFQHKINHVFIKPKQFNSIFSSQIICSLLNSGGGQIFLVREHANTRILSGFEPTIMKVLLKQYQEIKRMVLTSVEPKNEFSLKGNVVKLKVLKRQQYALRLQLFPAKDKFRIFYHKNNQKISFYQYLPEIHKIQLFQAPKLFDFLKRPRKKKVLHYGLPCKKGISAEDFLEKCEQLQSTPTQIQEEINYERIMEDLKALQKQINNPHYQDIWIFIPGDEKAHEILGQQLSNFKQQNKPYKLCPANHYLREVVKHKSEKKQLYFLFHNYSWSTIQIVANRQYLIDSELAPVIDQIQLNKSLTESCNHKFNTIVRYLSSKFESIQKAIVMYAKKQFCKEIKQNVMLKPIIHCIIQKGHKNNILALFSFCFMYYYGFKPKLVEFTKKVGIPVYTNLN